MTKRLAATPLVLLVAALVACKTGSPNTAVGAALTTAAGISAAAANRAAGGCIAICTAGTICNPRTGLCERQACDGRCGPSEICEETFSGSKCVVGGPTSVEALVKAKTPATPEIAPATAPPKDGSPSIVPAAQKQQNLPP